MVFVSYLLAIGAELKDDCSVNEMAPTIGLNEWELPNGFDLSPVHGMDLRPFLEWIHFSADGKTSPATVDTALAVLQNPVGGGTAWLLRNQAGEWLSGSYGAMLPGRVGSIGGLRSAEACSSLSAKFSSLAAFPVRKVAQHCLRQGAEVLQATASSWDAIQRTMLSEAGFAPLAVLDQMFVSRGDSRPLGLSLDLPFRVDMPSGSYGVRRYRPDEEKQFGILIQETYEGTLDCPALETARSMQGTLEGYLQGSPPPHLWWLVWDGGWPVGCILLAERGAKIIELVYLGLVPSVRRKGLGGWLLDFGLSVAWQVGGEQVVTSMDQLNHPAAKLYHSRGFTIFHSLEAWFAVSGE